jgi:hypothetical protein
MNQINKPMIAIWPKLVRFGAVLIISWLAVAAGYYFSSGLHAEGNALKHWEEEYATVFASMQKLYATEKSAVPVSSQLSNQDFLQLQGQALFNELHNRHLLTVWCQTSLVAAEAMLKYQPVDKVDYLLFRTGIPPRFYAERFVPLMQGCRSVIARSKANFAFSAEQLNFLASYRPTAAKNIDDLKLQWQKQHQARVMRYVLIAATVPVGLIVLCFVIGLLFNSVQMFGRMTAKKE